MALSRHRHNHFHYHRLCHGHVFTPLQPPWGLQANNYLKEILALGCQRVLFKDSMSLKVCILGVCLHLDLVENGARGALKVKVKVQEVRWNSITFSRVGARSTPRWKLVKKFWAKFFGLFKYPHLSQKLCNWSQTTRKLHHATPFLNFAPVCTSLHNFPFLCF